MNPSTPVLPRLRTRARPPRSMVLFAAIALAVFSVVHATIWWRLVGALGPPMRLGAPNEITVLTLRRA